MGRSGELNVFARPTDPDHPHRWSFHSGLRLCLVGATDPPVIVISRGVQLRLLGLVGLEPTHPRWPETSTSYPWRTMDLPVSPDGISHNQRARRPCRCASF